MNRHLKCFLVSFILLNCVTRCTNKASQVLAFKPGPDQVYQVSVIQSRSSTYSTSQGNVQNAGAVWNNFDTVFVSGKLVTAGVSDTSVTMKFTFSDLRVSRSPGQKLTSPAQKKGTMMLPDYFGIRNSIFKLLNGMSILVLFNRKGEVQEVMAAEQLIVNVAAKVKLDSNLSAWASVIHHTDRSMLHDYVSKDAIRDLFNEIFFVLPGREIKPGESWGNDFMKTTNAPVKFSSVFNTRVEGDSCTVNIQSIVSATTGEGGKTYLKGKSQGASRLSTSTGLPSDYQTIKETVTTTDAGENLTQEKLTVTISSIR